MGGDKQGKGKKGDKGAAKTEPAKAAPAPAKPESTKAKAEPAKAKAKAAAPAKVDTPKAAAPAKQATPAKTKDPKAKKTKKMVLRKDNPYLAPGIRRYGDNRMRKARGTSLHKPRKVIHKSKRFFPADIKPRPLKRYHPNYTPKLRSSITPGTVLIVLAGRFRGRRVVFLRQLKSGLLLVTGPYKINGVPLRRINQAYVIATKTKVADLSSIDTSDIDDSMWKKKQSKKHHERKRIEGWFHPNKPKKT